MTITEQLQMCQENPAEYAKLLLAGELPICEYPLNTSRGGQYVFGFLRKTQHGDVVLEVPDNCVGVVIGKGGKNVKRISSALGTRVEVRGNGEMSVKKRIDILI